MNQEPHSFSSQKILEHIHVNLDEFIIEEDNFKPMTKGLGFHNEQKRSSFKQTPKEIKTFGSAKTQPRASTMLNSLSLKNSSTIAQHVPTGLEAFYGTQGTSTSTSSSARAKRDESTENLFSTKDTETTEFLAAPAILQFLAWTIDLLVIASLLSVTGGLLVAASGIEYHAFLKLISGFDLASFGVALFSIYYLLYFTILDLTASPGKTILGLKIVKSDLTPVTVKNTFVRALISLLSSVALFLPMLLDFQGRLSDSKVVK